MIALQGHFEGDRFIHSEPIEIPRYRKAIVTILDEPADPERNAFAWKTFINAMRTSNEELVGEPERVSFDRKIAE
jgi:hypothetical protein